MSDYIITIIACQDEVTSFGAFIDVDNAVDAFDTHLQEQIAFVQAPLEENDLVIYRKHRYSKAKLIELLSHEDFSEITVKFLDKEFIFTKELLEC